MWEAIEKNRSRSRWLISLMGAVLVGLGFAIGMIFDPGMGGAIGAGAALVLWLVMLTVALASGDKVLLLSSRAHQIERADAPQLWNVVEEMTIASGLPKRPRIYIMDTDVPNAFAVGTPENAAVAVTSGLMMRLSRDELQGVVAHEIGHIRNQDTRFLTQAGVMLAAIVIVADIFLRTMFYTGGRTRRRSGGGGGGQAQALLMILAILLAILAPILAQMLYFACSRRREYLADASAARFTRYPEGLASALEKISRGVQKGGMEANRAVAPMYIINPLKGASAAHSLFSTHPPTEERVRILRSMAGGAGFGAYEAAYAKSAGKGLIGQRTLKEADAPALRGASAESDEPDAVKQREAVDILHRMNGMLFLACACGLKMKIPPTFKGKTVDCPRCGKHLPVRAAAMAAATVGALDAAERAERESQRR